MPSMRDAERLGVDLGVGLLEPHPVDRRRKLIAPPVAIIVLDGMQSHRWAAPPTTSRSIIVTSAPSRAAYVAAVLPAGPPPMITKRVVTDPGYASADAACHRAPMGGCTVTRVSEPTTARRRPTPSAHGGSGLAAERARRQAQVDELRQAGGEPYPYRFDRTHTRRRGARRRGATLEPGTETDDEVSVAGRVMLKRDTGKLVFATIADRGAEVQLFVSKAVDRRRRLRRRQGARPRRLGRRPRHGDDDAGGRAVGQGRPARAARQVDPAAARQVARARRPRHPVPPALRRPRRQRRCPAGVRRAPRGHRQLPAHVPRARLRRGRDAGAARRGRRRPRPPVRHPPQHARHAAVPARSPSSCTSSGSSSAAWTGCSRSAGCSATRACPAATTPSSR